MMSSRHFILWCFCYSLYYCMALIHDVMHEVYICCYVCVRMHRAACTACCAVLSCLIDWIVVPCFVFVVSWTSQSTPLPQVVSNDITSGDEGGIS